MLQLLKKASLPAAIARRPGTCMAGARYRFLRIETPLSAPPSAELAERAPNEGEAFRHLSFTFAAIALSARVASHEGAVSREAYAAFREAFPLSGGLCGKIRQLFVMACKDQTPVEHYISQITCIFPNNPPLYRSLMDRLFRIAVANGELSRTMERLLARMAHMMGVTPGDYMYLHNRYLQTPQAHQVLGVARRAGAGTIKRRYRELMRQYHPDQAAPQDVSPEVALLLQLRSAEINGAYHALRGRASAKR